MCVDSSLFIITALPCARFDDAPLLLFPIFSFQTIVLNTKACAEMNDTEHSKTRKDCAEAICVRLRDHTSFFIAKIQVF